jgi:hypothetical protein
MIHVNRHFLHTPQLRFGSWDFDAKMYSRMKHGCPKSLDQYADQLAPLIQNILNASSNVILCSSAYKAVPNTANLLLRAVLRKVHLRSNKVGRLRRLNTFSFDFAELPFEDRQRAMQSYHLSFDAARFEGKKVVILDDCLATGAHERVITSALTGIAESIECIYCINLVGLQPQVEYRLNREEISTLLDIMPLMYQEGYILNTRALRLLMNASRDELTQFMSCISGDWKKQLFELARAEEYDRISKAYFRRMNDLYLKMEEESDSLLSLIPD